MCSRTARTSNAACVGCAKWNGKGCAPSRACPKGRCPSGLPALAGSRVAGRKSPLQPRMKGDGFHRHQGFASPESSPGPFASLRAAASGSALDIDSSRVAHFGNFLVMTKKRSRRGLRCAWKQRIGITPHPQRNNHRCRWIRYCWCPMETVKLVKLVGKGESFSAIDPLGKASVNSLFH